MYSVVVAYLLWFMGFGGMLGLHRFYLRKFPTGFLWMMTGGCFLIGAAYDLFTIPHQVNLANSKLSARGQIPIQVVGYQVQNQEPKQSLEKTILKTAQKKQGLVTANDVAVDSNYTTAEIVKELDKLVARGLCEMRIRTSGIVVYRFPEFCSDANDEFIDGI